MTIHITNRKGNKLQLNGDLLTGDTFSMKDYIKSYLDGKWIADQKAWRVNVAKVNRLIEQHVLTVDDNPVVAAGAQGSMWADNTPRKISHDEFSRLMNDPNSDF